MFFYKCKLSGEVFAYASQDERESWGAESLVLMTEEEVNAHLNPPPAALSRDDVERIRLSEYANPLTGSDRLFAEAIRMQLMGEEGHDIVKERAIARFSEIQLENPWPEAEE